MKGPGGRMRFDLRRVWECPVCHRRDWTPGDIVFRACTCSAKGESSPPVWMKLIEEEPAPAPIVHEQTADLHAVAAEPVTPSETLTPSVSEAEEIERQREALPPLPDASN